MVNLNTLDNGGNVVNVRNLGNGGRKKGISLSFAGY